MVACYLLLLYGYRFFLQNMFHVETNTATMRFVSDYSVDDGTFKVNVWAAYPTRDQVSKELKQWSAKFNLLAPGKF